MYATTEANVQQRDTSSRHDDRVREQDPLHRSLLAALESSERRGCSRDSAVARLGVVLEWDAARERARVAVDEERVEEPAMLVSLLAELEGVLKEEEGWKGVSVDVSTGRTTRRDDPTSSAKVHPMSLEIRAESARQCD